MRRSNEPLWWLPFSAGMMLDALAMPAIIVITGILIPLGLAGGGLQGMLTHPLVRAGLFVLISLTFFHAAHRLRFALVDLGLKGAKHALGFILYGGAIVGTLVAAGVVVGLI